MHDGYAIHPGFEHVVRRMQLPYVIIALFIRLTTDGCLELRTAFLRTA